MMGFKNKTMIIINTPLVLTKAKVVFFCDTYIIRV